MKITARTLSGQACDFQVEELVFKKITKLQRDVPDLPWIAPGLIDIQVNGFGGIDFNREIPSDDAWRHATKTLYAHGCTGFLATLITNTEENYQRLLGAFSERVKRDPRNCLGFHMEGPWLNPDPGYRGAHDPTRMQKPSLRLLDVWWKLAGPLLKLITLAPEVDIVAAREVIREGRKRDIQFFMGHSAAMGADLAAAMEAGAIGWTHLGNAAPAQMAKFENVLFHAMSRPGLHPTIIPDGLHVPPHVFRIFARMFGHESPSRLLLTTDCMSGAGAPAPGNYTLGDLDVEVDETGMARSPGRGRLAGSTITPFRAVFLAEQMSGLFLEEIWNAFSTRPASLLGLKHTLAEGNAADFCLISPEKTPCLLATYHKGACVYDGS